MLPNDASQTELLSRLRCAEGHLHGIAAMITGGSIVEIRMNAQEGGLCITRGGMPAVTMSAGYLGSLAWGGAMLMVATRTNWSQIAIELLGALLLVVTVVWVRPVTSFGFMFGLATGLVLIAAAYFFKEVVLENRDFADRLQALPGTSAVVNAVSRDPNGIGYGGAAYAKGVREVPLAKDASSPAITPALKNVVDGSYALSRYLFFYTRQKPAGDVKKFVDWVLSPAGQKIAADVGYYPLK